MLRTEIPDIIGNAAVVCSAIVDKSLPTGNTQHYGYGGLLGPAYGLAICRSKQAAGYYLFSCDSNWKEFADTWHETVEDAMEQAEFEYDGISDSWVYK
jgi:hypothetical protein